MEPILLRPSQLGTGAHRAARYEEARHARSLRSTQAARLERKTRTEHGARRGCSVKTPTTDAAKHRRHADQHVHVRPRVRVRYRKRGARSPTDRPDLRASARPPGPFRGSLRCRSAWRPRRRQAQAAAECTPRTPYRGGGEGRPHQGAWRWNRPGGRRRPLPIPPPGGEGKSRGVLGDREYEGIEAGGTKDSCAQRRSRERHKRNFATSE